MAARTEQEETYMYGKITISFTMTVLTGMHIGASNAFSAIGAADSPVMRDVMTGMPLLPGSSLKGKLRTLLAKAKAKNYLPPPVEDDLPEVARLFGSPGNRRKGTPVQPARLQFADAFLRNADELAQRGGFTEIKFENTINRLTSVANPRQIERAVRGSVFDIRLVYNMEEEAEIRPDIENLAEALRLLCLDYVGGHGSRGYGRVRFDQFALEVIHGQCPVPAETLLAILKDVENHALFAL
jgi:CRISPR-associated protein Csm3